MLISSEKKQSTMKATVIADRRGCTQCTDNAAAGTMHDATAARTAGVTGSF